MGKCNSYAAELKVKKIKFVEQNRNHTAERKLSITEVHIITSASEKKGCAK
jgi:hypothetical protein